LRPSWRSQRHKGVIKIPASQWSLFYREGLFQGRIVLDQNWALEAIYAIFDRKKISPLLRGYGRFNREDLEILIWSAYTPEEQKVFLGMMESCGICFKERKLSHDEREYIAPELLPEWSDTQKLLLRRLRSWFPRNRLFVFSGRDQILIPSKKFSGPCSIKTTQQTATAND
jgi:hypothetical protein